MIYKCMGVCFFFFKCSEFPKENNPTKPISFPTSAESSFANKWKWTHQLKCDFGTLNFSFEIEYGKCGKLNTEHGTLGTCNHLWTIFYLKWVENLLWNSISIRFVKVSNLIEWKRILLTVELYHRFIDKSVSFHKYGWTGEIQSTGVLRLPCACAYLFCKCCICSWWNSTCMWILWRRRKGNKC